MSICTGKRGEIDAGFGRDYLAKFNTDNRASHKQGGNKSHNDYVVQTSGIDSDAPASVGQIHDVFAEYEETFGFSKSERKAAYSTLRNYPESETTTSSIPVASFRESLGTLRTTALWTLRRLQKPQEMVLPVSQREILRTNPPFSLEWKSMDKRQRHWEKTSVPFYKIHSPSPPLTPEDAIRSDLGTVTQATRTRKRYLSSTESTARHDTGRPQKRPRRATKETWKAREAREVREAMELQRYHTSSHSSRPKQAPFVYRRHGIGEVDRRVANIEDVYLGEDGSIQCVVTWKSSLITMENLGRKLRQQCEELFVKRYGPQELQRKA